jgi:hypothetical protein
MQNKHPDENRNIQIKPNKTSIIFFEVTLIKAKYKVRVQKKIKLYNKK